MREYCIMFYDFVNNIIYRIYMIDIFKRKRERTDFHEFLFITALKEYIYFILN